MRFILAVATIAALVWAPLLLWLPILVIAGILECLIPDAPRERTWEQYERDCLAGKHGPYAKANAEQGDYRHRVKQEQIERIVEE